MKHIFLFLIGITIISGLHAQWQPTNGPYGGNINCFLEEGQYLLTGTDDMGVFVSTDNGNNWTERNNGLGNKCVYALGFHNSKIYAGTAKGLFESSDHGLTWNNIIINGHAGLKIKAIGFTNEALFIATDSLIRSRDNGNTWTTMVGSIYGLSDLATIAIHDSEIYFGGYGLDGLYKSVDYGEHFFFIDLSNKPGGDFSSFIFTKTKILAASVGPVFSSIDGGYTWHGSSTGIGSEYVMTLAADSNKIYAGAYIMFNPGGGGLFSSDDNGEHWISLGLKDYSVRSLNCSGNRLHAGLFPGGVIISDNGGTDLVESSNGLERLPVRSISINGPEIYAASFNEGIVKSPDNGNTWIHVNNGLPKDSILAVAVCLSNIFAGGNKIFRSKDSGGTWQDVFDPGNPVSCFLVSESQIFAGTNNVSAGSGSGGLFLSDDEGETWRSVSSDLPNTGILSLAKEGNYLYAGTKGGLFVSSDNASNWTSINNGLTSVNIEAIGTKPDHLFVSAFRSDFYWNRNSAIFSSGDNGENWTKADIEFDGNSSSSSFVISGEKVITGVMGGEIQAYLTDDNGLNWSAVNSGLPYENGISSMMIADSMVYASLVKEHSVWSYPIVIGSGIWKRPLAEIIPFRLIPDTIKLNEKSGSTAVLSISCSTPWVLKGSLPNWLSADKFSGQGPAEILFTATMDNPNEFPHIISLDIISSGIGRHLCILQHGKLLGVDETDAEHFKVYPNPTLGKIIVETFTPFDKLSVFSAPGQLLYEQIGVSPMTEINLSRYGRGLLYIKLSGKQGISIKKIIVLSQ